jgi:hypothetical protein
VAVTCTSEDSVGNLYPVTEDGYFGAEYEGILDQVEDASLDRCYDESGGDEGCTLVGCDPIY